MAENRAASTGVDDDADSTNTFASGRALAPKRPELDTAEYPQVSPSVESAPAGEAQPPTVLRPALVERILRGVFWLVAIIGLVLALVVGAQAVGWLPDFRNPFATQRADRSQPPLLQSIQDLSRYVAAEGNFQVIIDVQQNQKYIPDFLVNDRVLFIAAGTVEAYVEFGNIGQGAIKESADRRTVEVTLPAPQLGKPNLDPDNSRVYAQQRGLLNRIRDAFSNDPNRLQEVYKLSEDKISEAAKSSGLSQRAQDNTRKMIEGLLRSLGYTTVTVKYQSP
jgi:hypothetical protein